MDYLKVGLYLVSEQQNVQIETNDLVTIDYDVSNIELALMRRTKSFLGSSHPLVRLLKYSLHPLRKMGEK